MPFNGINEAFPKALGKRQNNSTYKTRLIKVKAGTREAGLEQKYHQDSDTKHSSDLSPSRAEPTNAVREGLSGPERRQAQPEGPLPLGCPVMSLRRTTGQV